MKGEAYVAPRGRASAAFVEDAILFLATIVPLAYFFGGTPTPPILLLNLAHVVSVPCAGVAHSARLGRAQTFFLGLATVATTLVDVFVAAYCACRVVPTNLCCVALSSVGVACVDDLGDAPLALFLLPVSAFNALRGVGRLVAVWMDATPRARSGISFAFVACVKIAHVVVLWTHPRDVVVAHLLRLVVAYAGVSAIVASIDWSGVSSDALAGCFFLDQIVLALQAHETLAGRTSTLLPLGLAVASLVVTSGLAVLVDGERYDGWSKTYAIVFTGAHVAILWSWWSDLDATLGAIAVAYLVSPLTRTYLLRADAHDAVVAVAIVFLVVDATVGGFVFASAIGLFGLSGVSGLSYEGNAWIPWGLIASTLFSAVVCAGVAWDATNRSKNAKKNVDDAVRSSKTSILASAPARSEENVENFVNNLRKRATKEVDEVGSGIDVATRRGLVESIVEDVVSYCRELQSLGERTRVLRAILEDDGDSSSASSAWSEVKKIVSSEEIMEDEIRVTRRTYEGTRGLRPNDARGNVPTNDDSEAMRFVVSRCKEKNEEETPVLSRLKHAVARRSFENASRAKKIEAFWKIVDWHFD